MSRSLCLVQKVLRGSRVSSALRTAIKNGEVACVCDSQCQLESLCSTDNLSVSKLSLKRSNTFTTLSALSRSRSFHTSGWLQRSDKPHRINGRKTEINYEELTDLLRNGRIILVDVREPHELEEYGEIPGAVNIPLSELKAALQLSEDEFFSRYYRSKPSLPGSTLILYGQGPNQGITALEIAYKNGYNQCTHYKGGWEDWTGKTGQPLKKQMNA